VTDFVPLAARVLVISDTRTLETDRSGAYLVESLETAGHRVLSRAVVPDDQPTITNSVRRACEDADVVLLTGGTGLTVRDVTPEAIAPLVTKPIPGFGELFRWLSYEEIGTSTIQSRVLGALCDRALVFALPGSRNACRTAMEKILVEQLDSRHRPCNFAELLPRMRGEDLAP
jgi:molybdenum cofactor biosynthesis protein B